MFDELPPFMTVEQAGQVLQLGRSKTYALTTEWERTAGQSGLAFVWIGRHRRRRRPTELVGRSWQPRRPGGELTGPTWQRIGNRPLTRTRGKRILLLLCRFGIARTAQAVD
jgi:hypothetical protein